MGGTTELTKIKKKTLKAQTRCISPKLFNTEIIGSEKKTTAEFVMSEKGLIFSSEDDELMSKDPFRLFESGTGISPRRN